MPAYDILHHGGDPGRVGGQEDRFIDAAVRSTAEKE
nr:hypothetical protein [Nocardiopsis ganjiahuensis]